MRSFISSPTPRPRLLDSPTSTTREGTAIAKAKGGAYKARKPALTPDQVKDLREKAAAGGSKTRLASDYNISRETLYQYLRASA